jgi:Ribonucleotide reductase, barrel domain
MAPIQIIDNQNSTKTLGLNDLQALLQENTAESEINTLPTQTILEKTDKYLQIFSQGPQKQIAENQLLELLANICQEEGFPETAQKLSSSNLKNFPQESSDSDSTLPYSKTNKDKLKKLYLPPTHNVLELKTLIHRLSHHKVTAPVGSQIKELINKGCFLPHQNILKARFPYNHMGISLEDDLGNIFDQLKQVAINFQNLISSTINFSALRPKMAEIKSTRGFSSGPVSFIKIYTSTLESLRQNLSSEFTPMQSFSLSISHPDILEYLIFIKNFQKSSLNKHVRFLLEITPQFLDALAQDEDFQLVSPENQQTVNLLSAKNTFDLIISTILENPQLGLTQPHTPSKNSVDISGIINLNAYKLKKDPQKALLQDLIPIQKYLQKQSQILSKRDNITPNIKIYFTGWNDFLIDQKVNYSSINAIELAENLFIAMRKQLEPSVEIGISLNNPLLAIMESSIGLECIDNLVTLKTNLDGQEIHQLHPALKTYLSDLGMVGNDIIKQIYESNSIAEMYKIPTHVKPLFKTSNEIDHQFHLELQKSLESVVGPHIEKRIYFSNPLDQEKIKESLIERLKQGILNIGYFEFGKITKEPTEVSSKPGKNFLMTLSKNKSRRHREIQPPLFQIKKTEEVTPPPIIT